MSELKPCPFCGEVYPIVDRSVPGFEAVSCTRCGAWVPGEKDETAMDAWNRRAPSPSEAALTAERDRLREALEKISAAEVWSHGHHVRLGVTTVQEVTVFAAAALAPREGKPKGEGL